MTLFAAAGMPGLSAARAQPAGKVYRLAIVNPSLPISEMNESSGSTYGALFKELHRLGYVEGQNLEVHRFSGAGREEQYVELARKAVATAPDVIVGSSSRILISLQQATTTIPIVGITSDPVALGLVPSLAHPGGNLTGVSVDAGMEVWGKYLQIMREVVPTASKIGFLASRQVWAMAEGRALRDAADQAGVSLLGPAMDRLDEREYLRAFRGMAEARAAALIVSDQAEHANYRRLIVALTEEYRLPAIYHWRVFAEAGGLMAYGSDLYDLVRQAAGYVDRILKGAKPGDLPFQQASKFELTLNLKTAKALGIAFPTSLLVRADNVLE